MGRTVQHRGWTPRPATWGTSHPVGNSWLPSHTTRRASWRVSPARANTLLGKYKMDILFFLIVVFWNTHSDTVYMTQAQNAEEICNWCFWCVLWCRCVTFCGHVGAGSRHSAHLRADDGIYSELLTCCVTVQVYQFLGSPRTKSLYSNISLQPDQDNTHL